MEPSDRSTRSLRMSSGASIRSTFHRSGTPAGSRSVERQRSRSRGSEGRTFSEVKSPTIPESSRRRVGSDSRTVGSTRSRSRGQVDLSRNGGSSSRSVGPGSSSRSTMSRSRGRSSARDPPVMSSSRSKSRNRSNGNENPKMEENRLVVRQSSINNLQPSGMSRSKSTGRRTSDAMSSSSGHQRVRSKSRSGTDRAMASDRTAASSCSTRSKSRGRFPSDPSVDEWQRQRRSTLGSNSSGGGELRARARSKSREPIQKLGCLGGSTDMTYRNGGRSSDPPKVIKADAPRSKPVPITSHTIKSRSRQKKHESDRGGDSNTRNSPAETEGDGRQSHHRARSKNRNRERTTSKNEDSRSHARSKSRSRKESKRSADSTNKSHSESYARPQSRGRKEIDHTTERKASKTKSPKNDGMSVCSRSTHRSSITGFKKHLPHIRGGKTVVSTISDSSTSETGPLSFVSGRSLEHSEEQPRAATPNRVPFGDDEDEKEIVTYLFDRQGYCVRHPHVRLRRKKMLGGWKIIISNCPDCCVEEMSRLKRVATNAESSKNSSKSKKNKHFDEKKSKDKKHSDNSKSADARQENKNVPPPPPRGEKKDSESIRSSKHKGSRASKKNHHPAQNEPIFEFDISLIGQEQDESNDPHQARSVKSGRSRKSNKSAKTNKSARTNKSEKSARTNKSGKSTRTNKSSRTIRTSKSTRSKPAKSNHGRGESGGASVISRGSHRGSSERYINEGGNLRVAKMPFTDAYGREGRYTGAVNGRGLPNGNGSLRYNNGIVFEGEWVEGRSEEMDNGGQHIGFSDWKSNTRQGKAMKEQQREREMDDIKSMVSSSVRSQASSFGQQPNQYSSHHSVPPRMSQNSTSYIQNLPWSDVNGFGGHYTGEINELNAPHGKGCMRYSNGVVEDGMWCNGVYQPPIENLPSNIGQTNQAPSSSNSVWTFKTTPTMMGSGGGGFDQSNPYMEGNASVMGSLNGAMGSGNMYGNMEQRW